MGKYETAYQLMLEQGFSCSQAIAEVFAEDLAVDSMTVRKLASFFGGGMKTGGICGFATGGLMVLGMKYGQILPGDVETKKASGPIAREFLKRFQEINKGYTCVDLLGVNTSTPEGAEYSAAHNLHSDRCPHFLRDTIAILEDMLQ